jgi:tetratricopeptide (TPR) repeat protein
MKKVSLLIVAYMFHFLAFAQISTDSLMEIGAKHYDNKDYDKAVASYLLALQQDSTETFVINELAVTYFQKQDYVNAIKYSSKLLESDNLFRLSAYITRGSALDLSQQNKEAIITFKAGIKEFGYHPLLGYNLGFNLYKMKDFEEAATILERTIYKTPTHASSHLLLANSLAYLQKKPESLLALYYFLLLEPNTERSKIAFQSIIDIYNANIVVVADGTIEILLDGNSNSIVPEVDLLFTFLTNNRLNDNNFKEEMSLENFISSTSSIFGILKPDVEKMDNYNVWWDLYIPFFSSLSQTKHVSTYCYFITQTVSKEAYEWGQQHAEKIKSFSEWVNNGGKEKD